MTTGRPTLAEVTAILDQAYPPALAESWDRVGLVAGEPDADLRRQIEERCRDWEAHRKGTQIHLTGVRPFDDIITIFAHSPITEVYVSSRGMAGFSETDWSMERTPAPLVNALQFDFFDMGSREALLQAVRLQVLYDPPRRRM